MQAELDRREQSNLQRVITLLSRPVRIVKGQDVSNAVDENLFETEEEKVLHAAAEAAASHIRPDMSIADFLEVSFSHCLLAVLLFLYIFCFTCHVCLRRVTRTKEVEHFILAGCY